MLVTPVRSTTPYTSPPTVFPCHPASARCQRKLRHGAGTLAQPKGRQGGFCSATLAWSSSHRSSRDSPCTQYMVSPWYHRTRSIRSAQNRRRRGAGRGGASPGSRGSCAPQRLTLRLQAVGVAVNLRDRDWPNRFPGLSIRRSAGSMLRAWTLPAAALLRIVASSLP